MSRPAFLTPTAVRRGRPRASRRGRAPAVAVAALAGALLALGPAAPASAHVTVQPTATTAGGWTTLTFKVPNESETAGTVGLTVALPTDTPLLSVSTRPVPGWTAEIVRGDLPEPVDLHGTTLTQAPLSVTWTADPGTQISQGEFQEFALSVGPLPDEVGTRIVFPADQTYSDGTVVTWDEVSDDGTEPDHPAPELTTTAPVNADAGDPGAMADVPARVLGGVAVLLAAIAVIAALRRRTVDGSAS